MKNYLDKEYHPVIEDYISDYLEDRLDTVEKNTFEEVLVHDDDLRDLTFSAKEGKKLLDQYREIKARDGFMERLNERIASQN
ncbi:hypothetical protein [Gracilimonas amylolytica]|uniref:hypothetical protein n=1 Tax=Gracilimonas amylolytica TaxID=1749045 RepID=UPI000CD84BBB|nr:hypothetical protein [Gracilimonas amylolytica]